MYGGSLTLISAPDRSRRCGRPSASAVDDRLTAALSLRHRPGGRHDDSFQANSRTSCCSCSTSSSPGPRSTSSTSSSSAGPLLDRGDLQARRHLRPWRSRRHRTRRVRGELTPSTLQHRALLAGSRRRRPHGADYWLFVGLPGRRVLYWVCCAASSTWRPRHGGRSRQADVPGARGDGARTARTAARAGPSSRRTRPRWRPRSATTPTLAEELATTALAGSSPRRRASTRSPSCSGGRDRAGPARSIRDRVGVRAARGGPGLQGHISMAALAEPPTAPSALRDFVPDVDAVPSRGCAATRGRMIVGGPDNSELLLPRVHRQRGLGRPATRGRSTARPVGPAAGRRRSASRRDSGRPRDRRRPLDPRSRGLLLRISGTAAFGLVPRLPGFRGWPTLSVGRAAVAACVRDLALALRVMSGAHRPTRSRGRYRRGTGSRSTGRGCGSRVGGSRSAPVDPSVVRDGPSGPRGSARRRRRSGRRGSPDARPPTQLWNDIALPQGFASEGPLLDQRPHRPGHREIMESGRAATARDYLDAQDRRAGFTRTSATFFDQYDVLLAP